MTREHFSEINGLGRKKFCGQWVLIAHGPDGSTRVIRVNCKCWDCPYCGPRKAKRVKRAIRMTAEAHDLSRFVTLTLDPSKLKDDDTVAFINRTFAKWRVSLKRKFGVTPKYIRILEFQKNGNAHLHVLLDRFVPHAWIKNSWSAVGGGRIVNVKYVDIHRVSRYLAKYLTKEMLLSAPQRSRRVTTSRGIHLFEKQASELVWVLLKASIFLLYARFHFLCTKLTLDKEGVLESFEYKLDFEA